MPKQQKQNFLQGAIILSAAVALVKVIGAVYKIPLGNLIGTQGMSMFTTAYNIYSILLVVATAGLPIAISKMVSEAETRGRFAESRRIFKVSFAVFCAIGAVGTAVMMLFPRQLAGLMGNPDAWAGVLAVAPCVLFVSVIASYRGFHQGRGNMYPTAISQIFEASGKLLFGLALAWWVYRTTGSLVYAAAGAIGGVTIGTVFGALYMVFRGLPKNPEAGAVSERKNSQILSELLRIAMPITVSSSVLSLTALIDTRQIMTRLQGPAGFSLEHAQNMHGAYVLSITMFNLPAAVLMTLSVSVIPAIVTAMTRRDRKTAGETITTALKVNALLGLPAAAGLMALSEPIMRLMYTGKDVAEMAVSHSAPLLFQLGWAVPFVCLVSLTNAILQSLGRVYTPILTMTVGGAAKITLNYFLLGNPDINIFGAPAGTIVCYALITVMNLAAIIRISRPPKLLSSFVKPVISAAAMGFGVRLLQVALLPVMGNAASTVIAVVLGFILYVVLIAAMRAMSYNDVLLLPKGKSIARFLKIREI